MITVTEKCPQSHKNIASRLKRPKEPQRQTKVLTMMFKLVRVYSNKARILKST